MKNWFYGGVVVLLVVIGLWWLTKKSTGLPGEMGQDQGREHWERAKLESFTYNSNPPLSGPHDPDWIRPGVYDTSQDKFKLIHSLEHGYVVIHYNCQIPNPKSQIPMFSVGAHEDEGDADGDSATPSAIVASDCETGKILAEFAKKINLKRIIVQPNPEIDKQIVIVAWNRKLAMDKWNEEAASVFTRTYHNKGPEQTME